MNNVARIAALQGDRLLTASYAVKTISDLMKCSAMDLYNVADRLGRKD